MKKLYTIGLSLLVPVLFFGQTVQGTIKPGSLANSAIVSIKPSADLTAAKISTFYFAIAIPKSIGAAPTVAILTNFNPNIAYAIDPPSSATINAIDYYVYDFRGDGAQADGTEKNYSAAGDNDMVELTITTGGSLNLSEVGIVSLAGGGTTSNSYFDIFNKGTDITNTTAMFYGTNPVNSASGFDGLSYKFIGAILPVKFISFYALKSGDAAKLTWTVNDDANNEYFQVERSLDGRKYANLTRVEALANGKDINTYTATDPVLSKQGAKSLYYRIKQIDRNGGSIYSLVRILNVDNNSPLSLYPNPARTTTKLILDAPQAGKAAIILRDAAGKQVQLINMQLVKGINQKDLNVSALPSGDYNVTLVSEGLTQTIKLSKLN